MNEKTALILTVTLVIAILIIGIGAIIYEGLNLDFNDGKCQICEGSVIPVGHQYTTDYYCPNCQRFNKG